MKPRACQNHVIILAARSTTARTGVLHRHARIVQVIFTHAASAPPPGRRGTRAVQVFQCVTTAYARAAEHKDTEEEESTTWRIPPGFQFLPLPDYM